MGAMKRATGAKGGYVNSTGVIRYSYIEGRHLVVGRGLVEEFGSLAEAYAHRDQRIAAENAKRKAAPAKAKPLPALPIDDAPQAVRDGVAAYLAGEPGDEHVAPLAAWLGYHDEADATAVAQARRWLARRTGK